MLLEIAAILVAISVAILVVVLVPTIIEIKKTVIAVRGLTETAESEMKPILNELHGTLAEVKNLVSEASSRVDEVKCLTTALGETGNTLKAVNCVLGSAAGLLVKTPLWVVGAKAAGRLIFERFAKKRKEEG